MTEGPGCFCSFLFASDGRIQVTWSRWFPDCTAPPPTASPLASRRLGCTEVLEGLQKCLQTMRCILIDQEEEGKVEVLSYKGETANNLR